MSKRTLTLLAVGMLGVGGFASMDTEALAQTLSEESNSRSMSQLHSRDNRVRHIRPGEDRTVESTPPQSRLQSEYRNMMRNEMQSHRGGHRNKSKNLNWK